MQQNGGEGNEAKEQRSVVLKKRLRGRRVYKQDLFDVSLLTRLNSTQKISGGL
jgi:hypothetical protein